VIRPEVAQAFIEQLDIRKFYGVGKVTEKKMHALSIYNGADLKALSRLELQAQFGKSGDYYYNVARGIDDRPVRAHRIRKSIGSETTFDGNIMDKKIVWETLLSLSKRVEQSMDKRQVVARTITVKVKYSDFELNTRSKTCDKAITNQQDMLEILPQLLRKTDIGRRPIRLIGVTVSGLHSESENTLSTSVKKPVENQQLGLF